jgi:hypothetical protein
MHIQDKNLMNNLSHDECNLPVGEYIQESYSGAPSDADIAFTPPDIDKELAEMEARLQRHVQMFSCDPSKPYINKGGPKVRIGFDSELNELKSTGIDFPDTWGVVEEETEAWNDNRGKVCRKTDIVPNATRKSKDPFVIMTYHGGRNETYMFGPTHVDNWYDFDLAGAYTTGLVDLRQIDYDKFRHTANPLDFVGHVLGFALVEFKFPDDCRFPSLPVEMGVKGLYFPLSGTSYCTAPEIEVALKQGCVMNIIGICHQKIRREQFDSRGAGGARSADY